jgi:hypothetical protein
VAIALIVVVSAAPAQARAAAPPSIVSAFFGADDYPWFGPFCPTAFNEDGMPVIVTERVDPSTLAARDLAVITRSGAVKTPRCATLAPADEVGERRTILLVGDLGDAPADPPVRVSVVGSISTVSGGDLRGTLSPPVIPLEEGPKIEAVDVVAGSTRETEPPGRSAACPGRTRQTLRVAWSGGIVPVGRRQTFDFDGRAYRVTLDDGRTVRPFALGDRNDRDNYHELCLMQEAAARQIDVRANVFEDPVGDPNPVVRFTLP